MSFQVGDKVKLKWTDIADAKAALKGKHDPLGYTDTMAQSAADGDEYTIKSVRLNGRLRIRGPRYGWNVHPEWVEAVTRFAVGDMIQYHDGTGSNWPCEVTAIAAGTMSVRSAAGFGLTWDAKTIKDPNYWRVHQPGERVTLIPENLREATSLVPWRDPDDVEQLLWLSAFADYAKKGTEFTVKPSPSVDSDLIKIMRIRVPHAWCRVVRAASAPLAPVKSMCSCPFTELMRHGCKCGAAASEQKAKGKTFHSGLGLWV